MDAAAQLVRAGHVQPDSRSCGAQCVVMARALSDPALASRLLTTPGALAAEVLSTHRQLVGVRGQGWQVPWPAALGTPPWAAARALARATDRPYRTRVAWPWRRAALFEQVRGATRAGRAVPLYVGNRHLPRHVVLALPGADDGRVLVHDPATGRVGHITAAQWGSSTLRRTSWPVPWFAVLPACRQAVSDATWL